MTTPIQGGTGRIAGEVVLWPLSPVEQPGMPSYRAWQATIRIEDADGRTVARARSDADGRFDVALAPGVYRLRPEAGAGGPGAPPLAVTVTVAANRVTPVRITCDSGMR